MLKSRCLQKSKYLDWGGSPTPLRPQLLLYYFYHQERQIRQYFKFQTGIAIYLES